MFNLKNIYTKNKRNLLLGFVGCVLIFGSISGAYYAGHIQGAKDPQIIKVEGVIDPKKGEVVDFNKFWNVWQIVKNKYVSEDKTRDNQKLLYGAISGMVESLDDPNSNFFPPKEANDFNQEISGEFSGIGAEIGLNKDRQLVVISPLKDTPAEKAGLMSQDRIIKIDGESTFGFSTDQAVKKIRGEKGTIVKLTITRSGLDKEKVIEIKRGTIVVPTLDFKQLGLDGKEKDGGEIAYIRLYNFYEKSYSLFYQTAVKIALSNSKAIIFDLRGNPGGYLDSAVQISGWFVDKGKIIVTEEFRDKKENQVYESRGPSLFKDVPVVVLVDGGSASASEILAGALKENNGAIIAGQKSFGKGTVQEVIPMNDQSMLKLTIAHWLTPKGNLIDKNGIMPDVIFEEPTAQDYEKDKVEAENQWIKKAVDILKEKIK